MRVLITGLNGMMGSHLAEAYLEKGWEVHGTVRQNSNLRFIKQYLNMLKLHKTDLLDAHGIFDVVKIGFDVIHATASVTFVPFSWDNPTYTTDVIVKGTTNLLEAIRRSDNPTFHYFGSSEEYGIFDPEDVPLKEDHPLKPHSPYGVAKVAGEMLCKQYYLTYGVKTFPTRAFNHEGPRRGKEFIGPAIVKQAIQIKEGKKEAFSLGNLSAVRDMSDYRDMVSAYMLAVQKCTPGEVYNICSGHGYIVREMVEQVEKIAGLDPSTKIEVDEKKVRPTDIPVLIGDSTKFREATGWKPKYDYFNDTLPEIYKAFTGWRHDEVYE